MGLGLGLRLGLGGAGVLGAAGPTYDPDAMAWFEAVEATEANFGPTPEIAAANKTAWSNWVIAQKNAESPIAGRSNWDQLTEPGEGYIQPLMGVSAFNIPALFGASQFTSFVAGDYDPATGLRGGEDRVLFAINRTWASTPTDDFSVGMWVTGAASSSTADRLFGNPPVEVSRVQLFVDARSFGKHESGITSTVGDRYHQGTFPRSAFMGRVDDSQYTVHNGQAYISVRPSTTAEPDDASFFADTLGNNNANVRGGLVFYGRSIDLEAMNTACVALSEAIVWP